MVPTRGSRSCKISFDDDYGVSVQVRMQTADVAYRTRMEVQLGLVVSFSGKAPFGLSVLRYGGVTSTLGLGL